MAYDAPLKKALDRAGGPKRLAERLGIVPSAVTQWTRVPPRHVRVVAAMTGIPPHELRPDIFGDVPEGDAA